MPDTLTCATIGLSSSSVKDEGISMDRGISMPSLCNSVSKVERRKVLMQLTIISPFSNIEGRSILVPFKKVPRSDFKSLINNCKTAVIRFYQVRT